MSENTGKEIAKELAKSVYDDAGKSVAKPTGELLGLVPRAIKAALSPMEKWILKREYSVAETRKLLEQKLESIPAELIEEPEPYIALPAMESISYCMDNEELREMYANLLANSMIKVIKNGVHPGFIEIIKQLCPDEARILRYMYSHQVIPTITIRWENDEGAGLEVLQHFSDVGEYAKCECPYTTGKYFDNLIRLGLIRSNAEYSSLRNKELYKPIKEHEYLTHYKKPIEKIANEGYKNLKMVEGYMSLSDFGKSFCNVCLGVSEIAIAGE